MCSDQCGWALPQPGFPIRTSPDQRLLDGFPRLFAVCHVLHRLPAPRHSPKTLCSLNRIESKTLVLAMQFSRCLSESELETPTPSLLNSAPTSHPSEAQPSVKMVAPRRDPTPSQPLTRSSRHYFFGRVPKNILRRRPRVNSLERR